MADTFDVAAFLAENPQGETLEGVEAADGAPTDDAQVDDEPSESDDSSDEAEADADDASASTAAYESKPLLAAIEKGDAKAFLEALGDKADVLLGAKGHKALRIAHKDLKKTERDLVKATETLKARFGDPAAIRAAAAKGDADTVVDGIERFFDASWADIIKFVNGSFAGKPQRLEARAKAQREQTEASNTQRATAEAKVRETITAAVKKSDAKLLGAHPAVVDLVFSKLQRDYSKGVNTPAKALTAVKADLQGLVKALNPIFAASTNPAPKTVRPPRADSTAKGREMTESEFIADFLARNRP